MSNTLGNIGSFFKSPSAGPILSGVNLGVGEIGNLLASNAQDKVANLTPAQFSARVASAERPIDNSLVQAVNNSVQADMASRGLAQAPGIFAGEEAQALAPYAQQNYQTALNQVMEQLGLLPKGQNLTPAMAMFLQQLSKLNGTNSSNFLKVPNQSTTGPNLTQLGAPPTYGDTGSSGGLTDALNALLDSHGGSTQPVLDFSGQST
jgi:hypothetical protein